MRCEKKILQKHENLQLQDYNFELNAESIYIIKI